MSALQAIHASTRQLGLDEATRRALYLRVTAKGSARDMTEAERRAVVVELRRLGATNAHRKGRKKLSGKYVRKLQAQWIAAWKLGLVRNRDDAALLAFVKRQTGLDHARFLHQAVDARKAIEALKGWTARDGGVRWQEDKFAGRLIAEAQWRLLKAGTDADDLAGFGDAALDITGASFVVDIDHRGWIAVMNALGRRIRLKRRPAPKTADAGMEA